MGSASGPGICSLCVCAAAQFEASPRESGVISVWEWGPSSSQCWGAVTESIMVLCHSWVLLSLGRLCHHVLGNRRELAKSDFFTTGKEVRLRRKKPSGRSTPGLLAVCKMRACQGAFPLVRHCRLRWEKLTVGLNPRAGVSRLCDAACQPCRHRKDTQPARVH